MNWKDVTVVVALDAKTLQQARVSMPTWVANRPELLNCPWIAIFDHRQIRMHDVLSLPPFAFVNDVTYIHWPPHNALYSTQRERMLTSFVYAASSVRTRWWLKIDTDVLAKPGVDRWVDDDWFERQGTLSVFNKWIATRWGYTVGSDFIARLDDWGDTVGALRDLPRLDLPFDPNARTIKHRRMCSWISFYNTQWSQDCVAMLDDMEWRLPVPSQDTFHGYVSERQGAPVVRTNFKRRGFTNCSKLSSLKEHAAKMLKEDHVA